MHDPETMRRLEESWPARKKMGKMMVATMIATILATIFFCVIKWLAR